MIGIQYLLSVWQHSLLLLLRVMKRCCERSAAGLSNLLAPPQTNTTRLRGLEVDGFDCICQGFKPLTGWNLVFLPFFVGNEIQ